MVNVHELKTHERRQRKMVKMIVVLKSKVRWIFSVLRKAEKSGKLPTFFSGSHRVEWQILLTALHIVFISFVYFFIFSLLNIDIFYLF